MESKLNIHGLANPRGGFFMDGSGVEKRRPTRPTIDRGGHKPMRPMLVRPGRPKGGKYVPDDKPMPVTVKTLNPKPNERGGHKPIRPTVRPVRPPNSTKPVFVVTRPNIDDVEAGKIKYNQDVKAFVVVTNKAEQTAIKLAFDKKIKAAALAKQKAEKKVSDNVLNESNITKESNSISFLHTEKTKVFIGLVLLAGAIIYSSKNSEKSVKRTVKKTVKKSN